MNAVLFLLDIVIIGLIIGELYFLGRPFLGKGETKKPSEREAIEQFLEKSQDELNFEKSLTPKCEDCSYFRDHVRTDMSSEEKAVCLNKNGLREVASEGYCSYYVYRGGENND